MNNFIRLLKLCLPHYKAMLLGAFLTILTLLSNVGLLAISGWFLASMAAAGIVGAHMNYFTPAGIIRFLAIVRSVSRYGERLVTHNATFLLLSEIRVSVFETLSQLNNQDLAMKKSADLLNRMQNDVDALDKFYLNVLLPMIVALVCIPIVIAVIGSFNHSVAMISLTGIILVGVILPMFVSHKLSKTAVRQTQKSAELREALSDSLTGQRELALYQATTQQLQRCDVIQQEYNELLDSRHRALADTDGISLVVVQSAMICSVVLLIPLVASGALINVNLAMLSLFVLASFEIVLTLPNAFIQLPIALSAAKRIFELQDKLATSNSRGINEVTSVPSSNAAHKEKHAAQVELLIEDKPLEHQSFQNLEVALCFDNVSYQYSSDIESGLESDIASTTPVVKENQFKLDQIYFNVGAKEQVAIVGPSGSGKSTLIHLLSGLWPEQSGQISIITNHPLPQLDTNRSAQEIVHEASELRYHLSDMNRHQRSQIISVLAQEHHIFDGTIADNLRYAKPTATIAQMEQACAQAQLADWLTELPNGLNTRLGSGGRRMSAGQSRRLAIAQMILRQPNVLVLDEPTEGLDNQSKQRVMQAILQIMKHSTVLCVTHDAALLKLMDKVLWIENGTLKAQGHHQNLVNSDTQYANLTTQI